MIQRGLVQTFQTKYVATSVKLAAFIVKFMYILLLLPKKVFYIGQNYPSQMHVTSRSFDNTTIQNYGYTLNGSLYKNDTIQKTSKRIQAN